MKLCKWTFLPYCLFKVTMINIKKMIKGLYFYKELNLLQHHSWSPLYDTSISVKVISYTFNHLCHLMLLREEDDRRAQQMHHFIRKYKINIYFYWSLAFSHRGHIMLHLVIMLILLIRVHDTYISFYKCFVILCQLPWMDYVVLS